MNCIATRTVLQYIMAHFPFMKLLIKTTSLLCVLALTACRAPTAEQVATELPIIITATALAHQAALPTATQTLSPEGLVRLGQDVANSGDWAGAILLYDQAITQDPGYAQAYLLRGDAYKQLGDLTQAISNYDTAISIDPNMSTAYNNRGLAHSELSNASEALQDFSKAIELSPTFGLAYRNRADLQLEAGNWAAASLDLQVYLTLIPNAPDKEQVEAQIVELQNRVVEEAGEEGLLFADDFSDPTSGWYTNGDPASPGFYDSGGYRLMKTQPQGAVWALPGRLFGDVRIEVDATKMGGIDDNYFGIMCRVQGTTDTASFYVLLISSDGYYGIGKRVNEGPLELVEQDAMYFSSHINQGNSTNHITAICSGTRIALYVNGELLVEVEDASLASGQIGLMVGAFDVEGTDILFDNLKVYTAAP